MNAKTVEEKSCASDGDCSTLMASCVGGKCSCVQSDKVYLITLGSTEIQGDGLSYDQICKKYPDGKQMFL